MGDSMSRARLGGAGAISAAVAHVPAALGHVLVQMLLINPEDETGAH